MTGRDGKDKARVTWRVAVTVPRRNAEAFEELLADGETGRLVEIEDVDGMVDAIRALLADRTTWAQWADAARQRAVTQFRLDGEADAILNVYRELLAQA